MKLKPWRGKLRQSTHQLTSVISSLSRPGSICSLTNALGCAQPYARAGATLSRRHFIEQETGRCSHSNPPPCQVRTLISVITARMMAAGLILTVTTTRIFFACREQPSGSRLAANPAEVAVLATIERFYRRSWLHRPAVDGLETTTAVPVCHILFARLPVAGPREGSVAGRRFQIAVLKASPIGNLAIGHRIIGAASRGSFCPDCALAATAGKPGRRILAGPLSGPS
jgi:hypothetical protein